MIGDWVGELGQAQLPLTASPASANSVDVLFGVVRTPCHAPLSQATTSLSLALPSHSQPGLAVPTTPSIIRDLRLFYELPYDVGSFPVTLTLPLAAAGTPPLRASPLLRLNSTGVAPGATDGAPSLNTLRPCLQGLQKTRLRVCVFRRPGYGLASPIIRQLTSSYGFFGKFLCGNSIYKK